MCADEFDVDDAEFVGDGHYQSKVVAFDVEYHAVVAHKACAGEMSLDVTRCLPVGFACFIVPSQQSLLGLGALCAEVAQSFDGNDSHERIIVPYWDYV